MNNNNNNNKTKRPAAKKKSTTPTKPLTPAKKARGDKKRPALNRFTKKARKEAKTYKKNLLTRAMMAAFIKDVLSQSDEPLVCWDIWAEVGGKCHVMNFEPPPREEIRDVVDLMSRSGQLVRVGSDRYRLPEEEAPSTTPSGKHEVITADSVKEKENTTWGAPNLDKERFWADWTRKLIFDGFDKDGVVVFGSALLHDLAERCKENNIDHPSKKDFLGIVQGMVDDGEVVLAFDEVSLHFGTGLRPGPKLKTRGSKMPTRLHRTIGRERYAMRKAVNESLANEALTADFSEKEVVDHLRPVCDAAMAVLSHPHPCRRDDMVELAMISPGPLDTTFDRIFGEKPTYILKWTLIRPIMVGRIATEVLLEVRGETPLVAAQHFLAEMRYLASVRLNERPVHQATACARDLARAVEAAQKKLPGCALDIVARLFP